MLGSVSALFLTSVGLYEGAKARRLWLARQDAYKRAQERAIALARPLLVVGNPDAGIATRMSRAYGCGDLCIDLVGCPACPVQQQIDITQGIPNIPDDSAVVFVSCVLEYTDDPETAIKHLLRIAGSVDNLFIVAVDDSTLTSYLYPGAKYQLRDGRWQKIDQVEKTVVAVSVGAAAATVVGSAVGAVLKKFRSK